MYPSLYYFFQDIFGLEINFLKAINSFGFFVALAFIFGMWIFSNELKRKEKEKILLPVKIKEWKGKPASYKEIITNAIIGFILGYKLLYAFLNNEVFDNFPQFLFSTQGHWPGGIIIASALSFWVWYEKKKSALSPPQLVERDFHPHEHAGPLLMIAVVFGLLGAKIFAWLEDPQPLSEFLSDPFRGLTMLGGLICALLAGAYYMHKQKLPTLHFMDAASPAIILAYGIGRIGCHVAGDGDWGIVNKAPKPDWMNFLPDWVWAYNYPNNVNKDCGLPDCNWQETPYLIEPVFPTPFYETVMCILIFFALWLIRKKIKTAGIMFMLLFITNGIERFIIEKIRINDKIDGLGLTQAELISVIMIFIGIIGIWFLLKNKKRIFLI
jgi:prolipoprotein diacylglyceryl transferase